MADQRRSQFNEEDEKLLEDEPERDEDELTEPVEEDSEADEFESVEIDQPSSQPKDQPREQRRELHRPERPKQPEPTKPERSSPGQTRVELPKPTSPVRGTQPGPATPGGPAGQTAERLGGKAAQTAALRVAQGAGTVGTTGATGAATAGVAATGTAAAATGAAATGAAATAAAGTVAAEGAAAGAAATGALAGAAGPILIIILIILAVGIVITIGIGIYQHYAGGEEGGTPPVAADAADPGTQQVINQLAALAGDAHARQQLAADRVEEIKKLLDTAEQEIADAPLKDELTNALAQARLAADTIQTGQNLTESSTDAAANDAIDQLFRHLDRLIALFNGINLNSGADIAARARRTMEENRQNDWVFSTNVNPDSTEPLRDGSNLKNNKRGCDPAGFLSFVLRRDITDPNKITWKSRVAPAYDLLADYYRFVLTSETASQTTDVNELSAGQIVLTSKTTGEKTEKDLFIVLGDANQDGVAELAHCNPETPEGPREATADLLVQRQHTPTKVLKYRYE